MTRKMAASQCVESITTRWTSKFGNPLHPRYIVSSSRTFLIPTCARLASRSSKPQGATRRPPSENGKKSISSAQKNRIDASQKAASLSGRLSKTQKVAAPVAPKPPPPPPPSNIHGPEDVSTGSKSKQDEDAPGISETIGRFLAKEATGGQHEDVPEKFRHLRTKNQQNASIPARILEKKLGALQLQRHIFENQRKLLWPGIFYIVAIAGTYGAFAYLDARSRKTGSTVIGSQLPDRTSLPQDWLLTPAVIREGLLAGWNELDKLSMGIVALCLAMHFLRRSPLPIWEQFMHFTGEKKWTAFTYPLLHTSWVHLASNMYAIVWFLPTVVRYFDGDLFHTTAFLVSIPLITSYLQHFWVRSTPKRYMVVNLGASGAAAAVFGVFCMICPDEKIWMPSFLVLRADAKYFGLAFVMHQIWSLMQTHKKRANFHAQGVHLVSFGLGLAYAHFSGKENIWQPLLATFSKDITPVTP